jgi:hypothetical protein
METRFVVGCTLVAAALVLVSFSSVVGFQTMQADAASPLFTIRSTRAVEKESARLDREYIGEDQQTSLQFPERDGRMDSIDLIIESVRRMDDASLRRFAFLVYSHLRLAGDAKGFDSQEVTSLLLQIRSSPDRVVKDIEQRKGTLLMSNICTLYCTFDFTKECRFFFLLFLIAVLIDVLVVLPVQFILELLTLNSSSCGSDL